jgi:hypothetical protein
MFMKKPISRLALLVLLFGASYNVCAQRMEVQASLQAALFKKILTLATKGTDMRPSVLVVFDGKHNDDIAAITKSLEDLGLLITAVKKGALPEDFSGIRAAFLFEPDEKLLSICAENGIVTFSGYRDMVSDGKASIAIINEGGKPKLMLHRTRLTSEKSELLAQLEKVALIVQ